ncbi:SDR family NAD(P)-dependent oxidoreductase [Ovoidimarina sediminis]|uniref:SDR family NAD(P)-dependent oxidoreductase n=1 Tax=Ovoidimarina sediminis TaxID=3079856 RepID=UPI002913A11C|nr:SDR family oxidoreductase [Rhodophyticola sp. MJ-SS7]MDU8944228.1 SDR family oxidoreductase [Rhodophyticola sp. MJ-SS7]
MSFAQDLSGRRALITGGGRGLGRAIGERLAASGAEILVIDLPDALEDLPGAWRGVALDLCAVDAEDRLARLSGEVQTLDILVANAGTVPPWRGVDSLDRAEWERVMTLNVWAVAQTLGAFTRALARSSHASAILMASINGFRAHPKQVLYTASKHAVIGVARAAALDLGRRGIRVNAIAPGPVATEALVGRVRTRHATGGPAPEEALAALAEETALGRMATAEDVARVAHFLASDASGAMTGAVLPVEAGLA